MCCRDFKGIISTLLWESNEHLLTIVEVRATVCEPVPTWDNCSHFL